MSTLADRPTNLFPLGAGDGRTGKAAAMGPDGSGLVPYLLAAETLGAAEIDSAKAVLASGQLTMGATVEAFEEEFATWVGARHALMVNSGSSANLIGIDAMLRRSSGAGPLKRGDDVLVPALAWPTTVWPLAQLGLRPVLVDVNPVTLSIDLESARAALSPSTRGMFLVHVLGRAAPMADCLDFCRRYGILLIEDACESLGAHDGGGHVGLFGQLGTFSCYFSHHISTVEGGMLVTNDDGLRDDLASLRAHGWIRERRDRASWTARYPALDERFLFATGGYNVRPTEIHAAIGRVQLRKLDSMLEAREQLAATVQGWLAQWAPWLELIGADCLPRSGDPVPRRTRRHSWMTLPLRVRAGAPLDAAGVRRKLQLHGVETRALIAGNLARHPAAAMFPLRCAPSLRRCDDLLANALMIGCHPVVEPGALATLQRAIASLAL